MNYKADFPIFKTYPDLVYLDSAATTQKPQSVIDRIVKYYSSENANVHRGIYQLSELATKEYENARKEVAKFINADPSEVIFTAGATDSINLVGYSWIWLNVFEKDTILTTEMEHHSNFIPWQQAAKYKKEVKFEVVKVNKDDNTLDMEDLKTKFELYKPKIFAFCITSNTTGVINNIKEIVSLKNTYSPETLILVDAAQGAAHIKIDVKDLDIDFLAFSGHKMYGPTGIGVLWAHKELLENHMSPFRLGGGMITNVEINDSQWAELPDKFEGGTPNIEGAIGLAEAIKYINQIGFDNIINHEKELSEYTLENLRKVDKLEIIKPYDINKKLGVFSIHLPGVHPHDIAQILDESNICVRAGHHCTQILMKNVLKLPATTRISLGIYNSKEDIDRLVEALEKVKRVFNL
jgi:cysteine desulfurase/selenocysteine lyase